MAKKKPTAEGASSACRTVYVLTRPVQLFEGGDFVPEGEVMGEVATNPIVDALWLVDAIRHGLVAPKAHEDDAI